MANWWEEGAFSQSDVPSDDASRPANNPAAPAVAETDSRAIDWRGVMILALLALLVFVVRGLDMWRGQQLVTESQRNALRQTIAQELVARREGDEQAYRRLLDPQASRRWRETQVAALTSLPLPTPSEEPPIIESWRFQGETAMVDLRFSGPPATRETRFYRLFGDSWRRTPPIESFWGARRDTNAPGVRFVYREADAEAVQGVVEALRTAHRQGQVSVLAGEPLTVEIIPDHVVEFESRDNRLILPSPKLSPRLASVPDSVPILWRLSHPVADRLADPPDAARYRYLDSTQLFQDQLRYWALRWQAPFPDRWQRQMLDTLQLAKDGDLLVTPRAVDMFSANRTESYLAYYETLVMADYVAEQYGPAQLLALQQALSQVPSWDRAISATLGVEAAEFERGWRAHLDSNLTSAPATPAETTPTAGR